MVFGSPLSRLTLVVFYRQFEQFLAFCADIGFVDSANELKQMFEDGIIPGDTPTWIAYWIMKKSVPPLVLFLLSLISACRLSLRCDKIDLETGELRPLDRRPGYGTAQKMRAAMSHKFGRDYNRGHQAWGMNPLQANAFIGNPSLSAKVSQYMVSLRRTKVISFVVWSLTTCS